MDEKNFYDDDYDVYDELEDYKSALYLIVCTIFFLIIGFTFGKLALDYVEENKKETTNIESEYNTENINYQEGSE